MRTCLLGCDPSIGIHVMIRGSLSILQSLSWCLKVFCGTEEGGVTGMAA